MRAKASNMILNDFGSIVLETIQKTKGDIENKIFQRIKEGDILVQKEGIDKRTEKLKKEHKKDKIKGLIHSVASSGFSIQAVKKSKILVEEDPYANMSNIDPIPCVSIDSTIHNRSFSMNQFSPKNVQFSSFSRVERDGSFDDKKYLQISTERIKSINKEKRKLQLRKQKDEIRIKKLIQKETEKKLQIEAMKERERQERNEQILKKIEKRKLERELSNNLRQEEYKKVKRATPMFQKLRKSYIENHELPELQKKKEILTSIRDLHQPINSKDFDQHEKKWKQKRKSLIKKLGDKRRLTNRSSTSLHYQSKFMKDYLTQEVVKNSEQIFEKQKKSDYRAKLKHYGKIVQQTFRPEISQEKKQEVEALKEMFPNDRLVRRSTDKLSCNSIGSATPRKKSHRQTGFPRSTQITMATKNRAWKKVNPMVPKPVEKKVSVTIDYLQDLKKERSKNGEKPDFYYVKKHIKKNLKKGLQNSPKEKIDEVKNLSRALNAKAEQKLQQVKADKTMASKLIEESNNLIIDSIHSKLMLLEKLK
ncbi:unnamed protein product [Moneuplotes crassus]|uniref:Uncharacterized protein n=1 Tax=Euplotes crassus TaxID=5936 RepID=A0AAD1YDK9_EUPCR|nr:unnamed protein product [Moneuplotes crassus]